MQRKCKAKSEQNLQGLSCTALFFAAALILSHAATLIATPVAAQQATVLEEVIVTAQKREETLQEAPLAVTAFTQRDLEDIGAVEFGTVANKAPNMTLRKQTASHANYAFGIRGVSAGETALAVDSVVGLYIDGVYLGRLTGSAFDISDTERVEVLRGPQGSLYGRNAVAGAINIITNKPKEDFEFRNYLTGGERGLLRNQTTINTGNFPVAGGMLSARFNFSKWEHDGTVENSANGQTNGGIDSDAGRLSLHWDSGNGLVLDYNYSVSEKIGNSQIAQVTSLYYFTDILPDSAGAGAALGAVGSYIGQQIQTPGSGVTLDDLPPAPPGTPAADVVEARVGAQTGEAAMAGNRILAAYGAENTPNPEDMAVIGANQYVAAFSAERARVVGLLNELKPFPIYKQAALVTSADRLGSIHVPRSQPDLSEFYAHSLTAEWETPFGVVFKSITSHREWDSELPNQGNDFGTFTYEGPDLNSSGRCLSNCVYTLDKEDGKVKLLEQGDLVSLFTASRRSSQEQFTQEFQFSGDLPLMGSSLDWVGGFYYFQEKADEVNPQTNAIPGTALPFFAGLFTAEDRPGQGSYHTLGSGSLCGDPSLSQGKLDVALGAVVGGLAEACLNAVIVGGGGGVFNYGTENEAYALYWQGKYAVDDRTNLTVGLRYTKDDKEGYLESVPVFSAKITSAVRRVSDDDSWSKFTWDISVDHQWSDEVNLYGRIATGYRAGGYNVRINIIEDFGEPVDEENIISYEFGAKTQWFDNRLRANLTVFYAEYEDKQTSTFSPSLAGATSEISNFGEQTNQGVELEVLAVPIPGLTLGLNYGYTDVDIDKPEILPGNITPTPPYAPETTVYAWAQYEFAPSDYGTLSLRLDYDYADTFTISASVPLDSPTNRATERNLWGARISLNDIPLGSADEGRLSVAFWGRNLKNEEYREFVIPFGTFSVANYGELRSLGMDIVYDY